MSRHPATWPVVRGVRGERGSLALEFVMIVPAIFLLFGLIFMYGRAAQVNGTLESGTRDAARSATVARSLADAEDAARSAVVTALSAGPASCVATLSVTVSGSFQPGEPITVTSTCHYSIADIGLPGAPGTISPTSTFTSTLDPNRGIQ